MPTDAPLAYDDSVLDPAAEAMLAALGWDDPSLDRSIAAADEMLSWAESHRHGSRQHGLVTYFTGGVMAWRAVEAVLTWCFGDGERRRILDFASGWGRVTRFLVQRRPAGDVTVSDIDSAAVDFQRRHFGVQGFDSVVNPAELACGDHFDAVVSLSLFSHLPEPTFHAWLGRLVDLVAPGGCLLFSVHGESELPKGRTMLPGGIHFEPVSETGRLDTTSYGSSWASEGFVAGSLAALGRPRLRWRRFPRALWHAQDLYLVLPDGGGDPAECTLPDEPRGALEDWRRTPEGEVFMRGWAASERGPARRVEVLVGDRLVAAVDPGDERADVVALLGDAARSSGWGVRLPRTLAARTGEVLLVVAEGTDGTRNVLHAATLGATAQSLQLNQAMADAEAERRRQVEERDHKLIALGWEAEVLRRRIAAMEASRFWKLRNAWFTLKRWAGFPEA